MGRKASTWNNLPTGMRARPRGKKIHYYLDTGGKPRREIPLGSDYVAAVQKWAELTAERKPAGAEYTFPDVAERYTRDMIAGKAARTQTDNMKEMAWLLKFFGSPPAPLNSIEPVHIRQYMDWRMAEARKWANARRKPGESPVPANFGHVRANRDKALFSHIWNYARERGYTREANPCAGVKGEKELGRDVLVEEDLLAKVLAVAGKPLAFAIRLAALTGQRPADVLRMSESQISGGVLNIKQGKTRAKLRIDVTGELAELLRDVAAYKAQFAVHSLSVLVNEKGRALTASMFRSRFDAARKAAGVDKGAFQFRDLRASAATAVDDEAGTRQAQALLGHTTEAQTADYIRHKAGRRVGPVR